MSGSKEQLDRRGFLQRSVTATVAAGAVGIPKTGRTGAASSTLAAPAQKAARAFLQQFVDGWLPLQTAAEEADWVASTDVSEAHTAVQVARNLDLNRFTGAPDTIATVGRLLEHKETLEDLTVRQLEKVRLRAAEAPGTIPEVVQSTSRGRSQAIRHPGWVHLLHPPCRA